MSTSAGCSTGSTCRYRAPACGSGRDTFGNLVVDVRLPDVERSIEFEAWAVVTRRKGLSQPGRSGDPRLLTPTRLTRPDAALRVVAAGLAAGGGGGRALAERICRWAYQEIAYEPGVTDIHTTAAEALALSRGVCQDKAHVMITLCRLAGLPARYVSGHLLGEGASHAWVEVLVAEPGRDTLVLALDPTHDRRPTSATSPSQSAGTTPTWRPCRARTRPRTPAA